MVNKQTFFDYYHMASPFNPVSSMTAASAFGCPAKRAASRSATTGTQRAQKPDRRKQRKVKFLHTLLLETEMNCLVQCSMLEAFVPAYVGGGRLRTNFSLFHSVSSLDIINVISLVLRFVEFRKAMFPEEALIIKRIYKFV